MVKTVGSVMSGTLGLPMMRRFTEYSAIIIRMLASRSMILSLTFSQPVTRPAAKLPSTVRSGKRSRRKEIYTPKATRLKIRPISSAPSNENNDMGQIQSGKERAY